MKSNESQIMLIYYQTWHLRNTSIFPFTIVSVYLQIYLWGARAHFHVHSSKWNFHFLDKIKYELNCIYIYIYGLYIINVYIWNEIYRLYWMLLNILLTTITTTVEWHHRIYHLSHYCITSHAVDWFISLK